jgi:predicted acylesterase/phospholipase RssA
VAGLQCWLDLAAMLVKEVKRKVVLVDFVWPLSPFLKELAQVAEPCSFNISNMDPSRDTDLKSCIVHPAQGADYLHVSNGDEKPKDEKKVSTLISFLTFRYDYVLIRLPQDLEGVSLKLLKLSDGVYVYSEVSALEDMADVIKEFQQGIGFGKNEIRVILPDMEGKSALSLRSEEEILGAPVFSFLPSRTLQPERYDQVIRYIAKEFSGTLLGLALGSGAAYGLAHIGVLKVLEKNGIYPDVIAGSSIGALVGGLYAAGFSMTELEGIAKSIDLKTGFFKLLGFQDMSLAHHGFFKGHQVTRWLESHIGDKTFRDLKIPFKVVAANLFTSEEVIIDSGRVSEAIRASISIPGIFRPVLHNGTYLIDGGVVDPLPVRILSSLGVKKIIAVNVLPGPKDRIERNRMKEEAARLKAEGLERKQVWNRMFSRGKDKVYNRYAVNIFNVIMSTIQFLEYVIADSQGGQADVVIHPIVRDAHWAEFYSADKFIKLGEEKTELQMDEIKRLLAE